MRNAGETNLRNPAFQGYLLLRVGFVAAPILFGLDKFFDFMVDWSSYLAPWLDRLIPGTAEQFMISVGIVEIAAGILVALNPRIGSFVVALWLGGIMVNLLTANPPQYYDIALRDFGLLLGAVTLNRLAAAFGSATAIVRTPGERRIQTAA